MSNWQEDGATDENARQIEDKSCDSRKSLVNKTKILADWNERNRWNWTLSYWLINTYRIRIWSGYRYLVTSSSSSSSHHESGCAAWSVIKYDSEKAIFPLIDFTFSNFSFETEHFQFLPENVNVCYSIGKPATVYNYEKCYFVGLWHNFFLISFCVCTRYVSPQYSVTGAVIIL